MSIPTITKQTARRYVLGRQGLYPGRRWSGKAGTEAALRQAEMVQIDTINVIHRNHDLVLWSRVEDYSPAHLDSLLYSERQFFDFGSILMIYPTAELSHWRAVMQRLQGHIANYLTEHAHTVEYVRNELKTRGALTSRDFTGRERIPGGFNTIKDTGKALSYMWYYGELVTHSRRKFERIFDFFDNVYPETVLASELKVAEDFIGLKAMRDLGLATASEWAKRVTIMWHRRPGTANAQKWLEEMTTVGALAKVQIEGRKLPSYLPLADLPILEILELGKIPPEWQLNGTTTDEEVNFIAPLDNVIWDRARLQTLFDFDYVWEVYKPAELRRWGYYTMPILWGDKLVARFNPKLDRKTSTITIDGFWLEDATLAHNSDFRTALNAGLARFAQFHNAKPIINVEF